MCVCARALVALRTHDVVHVCVRACVGHVQYVRHVHSYIHAHTQHSPLGGYHEVDLDTLQGLYFTSPPTQQHSRNSSGSEATSPYAASATNNQAAPSDQGVPTHYGAPQGAHATTQPFPSAMDMSVMQLASYPKNHTHAGRSTDAQAAAHDAPNSDGMYAPYADNNKQTSVLSTPAAKLPEETRARLLHIHREATRGCDAMYWAAALLIGAFEHYRDAEGGLSLPSFVHMCSDLGMVPSNLTYAQVREKFLAACPKALPIADYTSMITCLRMCAEAAYTILGGDAATHLLARMRSPPSLPSYFSQAAAQERDELASVQPHNWDAVHNQSHDVTRTNSSSQYTYTDSLHNNHNNNNNNNNNGPGHGVPFHDSLLLPRAGSARMRESPVPAVYNTDASFDFSVKGLGPDMDLDGALKQIAAEHARCVCVCVCVCGYDHE
jgi:hypothetical protein